MSFINDYVIELVGRIFTKPPSKRLHHREHARRISRTLITGKESVLISISKHSFITAQRRRKNTLPMRNEQNLPRTLPLDI